MNGLTEDFINCVAQMITKQWHRRNQDIDYFVAQVKAAPITIAELDNWMTRNGDTCPVCVNKVFAQILYTDFLEKEGGDK